MAYLPILRAVTAEAYLPIDAAHVGIPPDWQLLPFNESGYRILFETDEESGEAAAKCEATRRFGSEGTILPVRISASKCLDAIECPECAKLYCELFHRMRVYLSQREDRKSITERLLVGWILERFEDLDAIRTDTMPMDEDYISDCATPTVYAWGVSSDACLTTL